ncbi:Acetyl-CoA acetyltransferase [Pyrodictium delaneyi]|uniref:Acetyl-CoA acetyltransferase n=1 Tax=Pyrodictium delaneyi TaxID=1273541 RepID=A0A0P0N1K9_9CREN|nr:thiolase domain-containing protein [Pyrodictium delaneyi]ALL00476.1 Acetyl-CoA acetyltransferase [Pyrodictium delaneyi]OWJ53947.1 acetyl-CoA acetyltransferase [Pyrodictium delaneyi]
MGRRVAIVGVGHSKYGYRNDVSLAELAWESIKQALNDAGIGQEDIDYVVYGNVGVWSSEPLPAVVINEYAGLTPRGTVRVEAACATGSAAIKLGHDIVASGEADIVLVVGVEKMNESPTPTVVELIGRAGNYFWEFENFGLTFPGYYALYATAYMARYGATEEDLCKVAVKNHYYASMNPKAHFPRQITLEQCMQSRYIAWPLKLFDCSPITDGSAAVILASEEIARKLTDTPVWIKAIGTASDTSNISRRPDFLLRRGVMEAARMAYKKAGIDPENPARYLDAAEVHDAFTIAEILTYEELGFAKPGEGYKLIREGQTYIGGLIPVNVSGGLKAKGHPLGATGVGMAVELTKQLRGEADKGRQVPVKNGMAVANNVGGTGHYAYVMIYSLQP